MHYHSLLSAFNVVSIIIGEANHTRTNHKYHQFQQLRQVHVRIQYIDYSKINSFRVMQQSFGPCLGGRTLIKEKFVSAFVCRVYGIRPATPHVINIY